MSGSVGDLRSQLLQLLGQLPTAQLVQNKNDAIIAAGDLADTWRSTTDPAPAEVVGIIHQAEDQLDAIVQRLAAAEQLVSSYANSI